MVFLKVSLLVLFCLSSTQLILLLLALNFLFIMICLLMIFHNSLIFIKPNFCQKLQLLKRQYLKSAHGCLNIFPCLIHGKPVFCLWVFLQHCLQLVTFSVCPSWYLFISRCFCSQLRYSVWLNLLCPVTYRPSLNIVYFKGHMLQVLYLYQITACNIATDLSVSKMDYCNTIFLDLPANQSDFLQCIQWLIKIIHIVLLTALFHFKNSCALWCSCWHWFWQIHMFNA